MTSADPDVREEAGPADVAQLRACAELLLVDATAQPMAALGAIPAVLATARSNDLQSAVVLLQAEGLAHRSLWNLEASRSALDEAVVLAEGLESGHLACMVRISRSGTRMYAGDISGAMQDLDDALRLGPSGDRSAVRHQRGIVLTMEGRYNEAVREATSAIGTFRRAGNHLWEARGLLNRSNMHLLAGHPATGKRDAIRALASFESIGHSAGVAKSLDNLGCLRALEGDLDTALADFTRADAMFAKLGIPLALAAEGRVSALMHARLADDAFDLASAARLNAAERGATGAVAEMELALARAALQIGDAATARRSALIAKDLFHDQGRFSWSLVAELIAAAADGRIDPASGFVLGEHLERLGWRAWAQEAWLLAGITAHRDGDVATATSCLRRAALRHASQTTATRIGVLRALTILELLDGDVTEALALAHRAFSVATANRLALTANDLNFATGGVVDEVVALGIDVAMHAHQLAQLWPWLEGARHIPGQVDRIDERLSSEERVLVVQLRATAAHVDGAHPSGSGPARELLVRQSRLERDLRATRQHRHRSATLRNFQCPSAKLVAGLGHRVLVHYFEHRLAIHALRTVGDSQTLHHLGPAAGVRRAVDQLRAAMIRAVGTAEPGNRLWSAVSDRAERLDQLVAAPLGLGTDCVVSPCGVLFGAPWGVLPSLSSASVAVVRSGSEWLGLSGHRSASAAPRVLCVGGPGLAVVGQELDAISAAWGGCVRLDGEAASLPRVKRALVATDIAHLSCHGILRVDSPSLSGLELADGPLQVRHIRSLSKVPHTIVLSACSGASGVERASGQFVGLGSSLVGRGVRSVIAAVLPVADSAMVVPMAALHVALEAGATPGVALSHARASVAEGSAADRASIGAFVTLGWSS